MLYRPIDKKIYDPQCRTNAPLQATVTQAGYLHNAGSITFIYLSTSQAQPSIFYIWPQCPTSALLDVNKGSFKPSIQIRIMPPSREVLIANEKKKIAIAAILGFTEANGIRCSKRKLIADFGISPRTFYSWFPINSTQPFPPPQVLSSTAQESNSVASRKRARSPDSTEEGNSSHDAPPPPKRQNPVRNGGRGRERLRAILEDLHDSSGSDDAIDDDESPPSASPSSPSPSPPHQLPTPPKHKIAAPHRGGPRSPCPPLPLREQEHVAPVASAGVECQSWDCEVEV